MTREEAIQWLKLLHASPLIYGEHLEAIDMAIKALEDQEQPNICPQCGKVFGECWNLIRCKDCKRYESDGGAFMTCTLTDMIVDDNCYCWWAERREK